MPECVWTIWRSGCASVAPARIRKLHRPAGNHANRTLTNVIKPVKCSCHHGMARRHVADGRDDLQTWRVAANMLNKQTRTADKGWSSSLGVGRRANNYSP